MSFEKINPSHPDKVADRIAGAIVDLAYTKQENPKIAVEVLIGHGNCYIVTEASVHMTNAEIREIIDKITTDIDDFYYLEVPQDAELAKNQAEAIRCGDNGIFKGVLASQEENLLSKTVRTLYENHPTDGKFIYDQDTKTFIACQSNATSDEIMQTIIKTELPASTNITINPLGPWTGGTSVDTGATNRKLGSDMGRAVTGGGLHGKDLSKADVSVNIACHLMAQANRCTVEALCAIGDESVTFKFHRAGTETTTKSIAYSEVVAMARDCINEIGGFEKLAEWGLIR